MPPSAVSKRPSGPGYRMFQANCSARISTSAALAGMWPWIVAHTRWLANVSQMRITAGIAVQMISATVFPWT